MAITRQHVEEAIPERIAELFDRDDLVGFDLWLTEADALRLGLRDGGLLTDHPNFGPEFDSAFPVRVCVVPAVPEMSDAVYLEPCFLDADG